MKPTAVTRSPVMCLPMEINGVMISEALLPSAAVPVYLDFEDTRRVGSATLVQDGAWVLADIALESPKVIGGRRHVALGGRLVGQGLLGIDRLSFCRERNIDARVPEYDARATDEVK